MQINQTSFLLMFITVFAMLAWLPEFSLAASKQQTLISNQKEPLSQPDSSLLSRNAQALDDFHAGRLDKAQKMFEDLSKEAQKSGNKFLWASSLTNLGNVKSEMEQFDAARHDYLESANIASTLGFHAIAAKATINAARNEIVLGNKKYARDLLRLARNQLKALAESPEKAELDISLGYLLHLNDFKDGSPPTDLELTWQVLGEGTKIAETLRLDDLLSYGYGYMGSLYLDKNRLPEALELTSRAEFIAQSINKPEILFRWQWQNARILSKQGAKAQAISAYQRAIATLQPIHGELAVSTLTSDTQGNIHNLYLELADLLLQEKNIPDSGLAAVRDLIEQGKVIELEDYYRDDCVSIWLNKSLRIDRLAARTAALYPIMLPDRLELLLSLPDGLHRYTVYKDRKQVVRDVEQFRATLENRGTPEFLPYAQSLYNLLISPVNTDLLKYHIETLVFIPDTTFRIIPIAALHDGKDFLVKHYAVATSPGLNLTDPHPIERNNSQALLLGLSKGVQGFQALPNVQDEIHAIAELFPATVLENQNFTMNTMREHLVKNSYRIVHIASHGQFNRKVANSFILTSDGKISLEQLGNMMSVSRYKDEPVELLTLSACQTAAGDDLAALGLAGVAVKAGARSALASLWFINDPASAMLVSEFYRQLKKPEMSKAKALQKAQLALLNDERYEHPGFWSPFLMIGNWL